jgi:hypothetical protein
LFSCRTWVRKKLKVAAAIIRGATVEAGPQEARFDKGTRRIIVEDFTGGIFWHRPGGDE